MCVARAKHHCLALGSPMNVDILLCNILSIAAPCMLDLSISSQILNRENSINIISNFYELYLPRITDSVF